MLIIITLSFIVREFYSTPYKTYDSLIMFKK